LPLEGHPLRLKAGGSGCASIEITVCDQEVAEEVQASVTDVPETVE